MKGREAFSAGIAQGDVGALKQKMKQSPAYKGVLKLIERHPEEFTLWSNDMILLFLMYCADPDRPGIAENNRKLFAEKLKVIKGKNTR